MFKWNVYQGDDDIVVIKDVVKEKVFKFFTVKVVYINRTFIQKVDIYHWETYYEM